MAKFLVYIPSPMAGIPNLQIRVEAENWMLALQLGRQKVGENTQLGSNIMCDFKEDGSIEITDPNTGKAFSIKEIEEESAPVPAPSPVSAPTPSVKPTPQVQNTPAAPQKPIKQETPLAAPAPSTPSKVEEPTKPVPPPVRKEEEAKPASKVTTVPAMKVEPPAKPIQKPVQYQPVEKPAEKIEANIEEVKEVKEERTIGRRDTKVSSNIDSIMTSLFSEVFDVYNSANSREEAANFMLDLAMKKIGVEAGSVLYADLSESELSFIAVRGPKSEEIKRYKVPIGKGIVGFCVDLGVSLAVSDVNKDKRWFDKISKSIGFPTKSILCAPIQYEGQTIGAIELINKKGNGTFSVDDISILNYIAHETGEAFIRIEGKRQQKS